jgi:hypothetical protein
MQNFESDAGAAFPGTFVPGYLIAPLCGRILAAVFSP